MTSPALIPSTGLQLRSLITASGELQLSLASVAVPAPGPDEVLIRIEATPINPSDIGLLFGAADMASAKLSGSASIPRCGATASRQPWNWSLISMPTTSAG